MNGLKRNNISYKEKARRPKSVHKYKKLNSAAKQLAQASPFSLERECSSGSVKNRRLTHSSELYLA